MTKSIHPFVQNCHPTTKPLRFRMDDHPTAAPENLYLDCYFDSRCDLKAESAYVLACSSKFQT